MKYGQYILAHKIKRKILKFDLKYHKIISIDAEINEFLKNKKVLIISPYPSIERLNSQMYDEILKKIHIAKEVEQDNNNLNMDFDSALNFEIHKIKYLKGLDEIVGISELDEKNTEKFIKENKVPNISFIVDPNRAFNSINDLDNRYEMLLNNTEIVEYRIDPTFSHNILIGVTSFSMNFMFLLITVSTLFYIFTTNRENELGFQKIYESI